MSWVWLAWLIGVAVLVVASFWALEAYALRNNKTTLSRFIWNASNAWRPLPFLMGYAAGAVTFGLAVHFWWHWCPS